jgi:endo-alpha-1,4-polygalactosaminidase (GH114 family)
MQRYTFFLICSAFCLLLNPSSVRADGIDENIDSWGIQLSRIDVEKIADSTHDLVVIDYAEDGGLQGGISKEEVLQMKQNGKKVIAYLPLGFAEMKRFYWNSQWQQPKQEDCYELSYNTKKRTFEQINTCPSGNAALVGEKTPGWNGRFEAKYYKRDWWDLAIEPMLNRIIELEFDGVYLAGIDAFYTNTFSGTRQKAANEMATLVAKTAYYARRKAGQNYIIIAENGSGILIDASAKWRKRFTDIIDALAIESFVFDTSTATYQRRIRALKKFKLLKKPVLTYEYTNSSNLPRLQTFLQKLTARYGITTILYRTNNDKALDVLHLPNTP